MALPRWLVEEIRRLDEPQLRQLLVLGRGLLVTSESPVLEIEGLPGMPTVRYRQKPVKCGKPTCTRCPHGPYWYAHWVEDGRRRSRYIGAELPPDVRRKLEEMETEVAEEGAIAADGTTTADPRPTLRLVRE
ncbi:hypothetical protein [Euzebya tangerina]|uniref:hypothetical protein n=1 Tax=Euzebya tangerina TaxID=591198 RepID=UPI000E31945C|nr:hypothetical protein [Euzebya tangerina]